MLKQLGRVLDDRDVIVRCQLEDLDGVRGKLIRKLLRFHIQHVLLLECLLKLLFINNRQI